MPKSKALKAKSTTKKAKSKKTIKAIAKKKSSLRTEDIKTKSTKSKKSIKSTETQSTKYEIVTTNPNLPQTRKNVEKINDRELLAQDALTQYMMKIRNYPVLSKEEEHKLAVKYYDTGDKEAAELLIKSNLKFVVKIAMEYSKFGARLIDIIQEGNVGLMYALKEYNPYKGVKLISYAVWWIRGYIQDYLMKQQSLVRIGTNQKQRKLFYQLEKEQAKIRQEGLESTPLLLSQRLHVPEKDVVEMQQRLSGKDLSLDNTLNDDSDTNWLEQQSDESSDPIDDIFIQTEQLELLKDKIEDLKKDLSEKELQMLNQRILNDNPVTLKSLGDEWGVTREAARQTEARLIEKIKKAFLAS